MCPPGWASICELYGRGLLFGIHRCYNLCHCSCDMSKSMPRLGSTLWFTISSQWCWQFDPAAPGHGGTTPLYGKWASHTTMHHCIAGDYMGSKNTFSHCTCICQLYIDLQLTTCLIYTHGMRTKCIFIRNPVICVVACLTLALLIDPCCNAQTFANTGGRLWRRLRRQLGNMQ